MTVEEMHIDFKRKANKVDSEKKRNFRPEEIDMYLNEGQELFFKREYAYFEVNQKITDDLRMLVVRGEEDTNQPLTPSSTVDNTYIFDLTDLGTVNNETAYLYLLRSYSIGSNDTCSDIVLRNISTQTDDLNTVLLQSEFYSPSFEWREVPITMAGNKLYVYTDGTFQIDELKLDYIKRPARIANPNAIKDSSGVTIGYNYPDGTAAVQTDCELQSSYACREIVDEAIRIAFIDIGDERFQMANFKTQINK